MFLYIILSLYNYTHVTCLGPCDCTAADRKPKRICAVFRGGKLPLGSECEYKKLFCKNPPGSVEKTSFRKCLGKKGYYLN